MTKYKALSDLELLNLIRSDDHNAFHEIFGRYMPVLYVYLNRRLGDTEQSKDLVHDIFIDFWIQRNSEDIVNMQAYLLIMARNKLFNLIKHNKVSERYIDELRKAWNGFSEPADYLARRNNLNALIDREVAELPEKLRVAFEMNRKKNMSIKEMAFALDISEEALRSRIRRANDLLRGRLGLSMVVVIQCALLSR